MSKGSAGSRIYATPLFRIAARIIYQVILLPCNGLDESIETDTKSSDTEFVLQL